MVDDLLADALLFFEHNPEKFCTGCLARRKPSKPTSQGRAVAPSFSRAVAWSLPGYLMLRSVNYDYSYDEAITLLSKTIREVYWAYEELSEFGTVCWLNDEMGYNAVINILREAIDLNGNSNSRTRTFTEG